MSEARAKAPTTGPGRSQAPSAPQRSAPQFRRHLGGNGSLTSAFCSRPFGKGVHTTSRVTILYPRVWHTSMATAAELTTEESEARRGGDRDPRGRVGIKRREKRLGWHSGQVHLRMRLAFPGTLPTPPYSPVGPEFPRFSRGYGRRDRNGRRSGSPQEELTESPESGRRDPSRDTACGHHVRASRESSPQAA